MPERITTASFKCGARIFSEGEPGHITFIVRKGIVRISQIEDGVEQMIADCGPGNIIGEMAVVSDAHRSATAVTDCVLSAIPKEEIDRRLEDADPILKILLLTSFERIRERAARRNYYRPVAPASDLQLSPKPLQVNRPEAVILPMTNRAR